jgi:hypothetical protein
VLLTLSLGVVQNGDTSAVARIGQVSEDAGASFPSIVRGLICPTRPPMIVTPLILVAEPRGMVTTGEPASLARSVTGS